MTRLPLPLGLIILLVVALAIPAVAQEETGISPDPDISLTDLELRLTPLTREKLEETANLWLNEGLMPTGSELAAAEIAGETAKAGELRTRRDALAERFKVIVTALERKGGDEKVVTAFRTYVDVAVAGGEGVSLGSAEKLMNDLIAWVQSPDGGIKWGSKILLFILTLIAFRIIAAILGKVTAKAVSTLKRTSELLKDFFVNVVKKLTFFIGIVIALSMIDVNVGPFVAAIGAVGFVIGFALQGTLSNFASGIMILAYRPYDIGDVVNVSGVTGKVNAMTLVSTTVKTPDNQIVVIPNSSIWGDVITNITGSDTRRVDLVFGIGYSDDIDKAKTVLQSILDGHEKVLKDPAHVVQVHELADSSVNFVVRPWVRTSDYWDVYWDITAAVKRRFDEEGISIPFPQRDVHMHTVAAE